MTSDQKDHFIKVLCACLSEVLSGVNSVMAHDAGPPGIKMIPVNEKDVTQAREVLEHVVAVAAAEPEKPSPIIARTVYFNILRARTIMRFKDEKEALKVFNAVCEFNGWQYCLERLDDDSGAVCHLMAGPGLPADQKMTDYAESQINGFCAGYLNRIIDETAE